MKLSVLIVNWNTCEHLRNCLAAASRRLAGVEHEIIVVDNASGDGSAEMARREFPGVTLLCNPENRGFAAACNQAAKRAAGEFLLLLNPDVILGPDTARELLSFVESRPDAVAGAVLLLPNGRPQLGPGGRRISPRTAFNHYFFLSRLFPGTCRGIWLYPARLRHATRLDWLSGACLLMRRAHFEAAGGFDENFFLYAEDHDLCDRLAALGVQFYLLPGARAVHDSGAAVRAAGSPAFGMEALHRYCLKHLGPARARRVMACAWLGLSLRAALFRAAAFVRENAGLREQARILKSHSQKARELMKP